MKKLIPTYEVRADIFDKILIDYSPRVRITDNLKQYVYGYKNKKIIYTDGDEYLICLEYILDGYTNCCELPTSWKQCRLRRVENAQTIVQKTITGTYAWNYLKKILTKYYSEEEIENILCSHEAEYSEDYKQFHYNISLERDQLIHIPDCVKYDINGAHCAAVVELFPNAANEFLKLYSKRKEKPIYKQIFNYAVGRLCKIGHRKTYNWIVQRTTKTLYKTMDKVRGSLIYANTDGFLVQDPENKLTTSTNLNDFKLEYSGDVWVYRSNNYILYQCGKDSKVGSCRNEVRDRIDLSVGQVVDYKTNRICIGEDEKGHKRFRYELTDIVERKVNIYEY